MSVITTYARVVDVPLVTDVTVTARGISLMTATKGYTEPHMYVTDVLPVRAAIIIRAIITPLTHRMSTKRNVPIAG
jgi:hypothetical protein